MKLDLKQMVATTVQRFLPFDLQRVNALFDVIFHVIIGQFITFMTDAFLGKLGHMFFTRFGTVIISPNPQV